MRARRRREFKMTKSSHGTFEINLNSMTDMFTLLLVFLLQFQSSNEIDVVPEKNLHLPASTTESKPSAAIQVQLSLTNLTVENNSVAKITEHGFEKTDMDPKDHNLIVPLFNALQRLVHDKKPESRIFLIADETHNYKILKKIMYTASVAGFPNLNLATVVGR